MKQRMFPLFATVLACLLTFSVARAQERESSHELGPTPKKLTHPSSNPDGNTPAISRPTAPSAKKLGKKFWILWAAGIGLQIGDVELTAHCLKRPTCQEGNPLLGKRPTRAYMYAIKAAVVGFGFYFSRRWKLSEDATAWWVPPVANIGAGGLAVAWNLSHLPPYPKPETPQIANTPAADVVPLALRRHDQR